MGREACWVVEAGPEDVDGAEDLQAVRGRRERRIAIGRADLIRGRITVVAGFQPESMRRPRRQKASPVRRREGPGALIRSMFTFQVSEARPCGTHFVELAGRLAEDGG